MTGFRRYPDYRDPGVEWLGEIPAHWEVVELGSVGAFSKGRGGTKLDEEGQGVPCVRYGDLYTYHDHHIVDTRSYLDERVAEAYTPITYGDVLFAASGETLDEIGKSAANLIRSAAVCGGDVIIFRPDGNPDSRFLGYSLGAAHGLHQKAIMGRGFTVVHIYIPQLRRLGTPLPPIPEQRAIADFLDRQTSRIDRLVRKKERLIELLKEKRASLISHAVTRGPDPDAPMMDSGVEWLGEIPAHWEVVRLKAVANVQLSSVNKKTVSGQPSVRLCNYTDVYYRDEIRRSHATAFMKATARESEIERFGLRKGDVLITKDSETPDDIAVPAIIAEDLPGVVCGYHLAMLRPNSHLCDGSFLGRAIGAAGPSDQFRLHASGVTRFGLTLGSIADSVIPLPPLPEQRAIADFLDGAASQIDALVTKTNDAIDRLREYRASVISAAVTGRIDVRDPSPPP